MRRSSERIVLIVFAALALMLVAKGVSQFLGDSGAGYDLKLSWVNERYFARAVNPFDVAGARIEPGWLGARKAVVSPDLGIPEFVTYPPWSYPMAALFDWPQWPAVKNYFLFLNAACCAFLFWWIARTVEFSTAKQQRWWVAAAILSNVAISQTIINGNYGIIVTAFIAAAFLLEEAGWNLLAGLLMGLAMIKPTIAGPFLLIFMIEKKWVAAMAASGAVAITWVGASIHVHTNPIEFLGQMLESSRRFELGGYAIWQGLAYLGMPRPAALIINAVAVIAPALFVMHRVRCNRQVVLAVAALCSRLFTYHTTIDNVALLFVPVALWNFRLESKWAHAAFWVFVCSLATPWRVLNSWETSAAVYCIWICGAAPLLLHRAGQPGLQNAPA